MPNSAENKPRASKVTGRRVVFFLVLVIGLLTAFVSLLGQFLAFKVAALIGLILALGITPLVLRAPLADLQKISGGEWFVLIVGSAAAWLSGVGGQQLFLDSEFLHWRMPLISDSLSPVKGLGMGSVSGLFGGDPLASALLGVGLIQVLAVIGCFLFTREHLPGKSAVRVVALLYLLLSSDRSFILVQQIDDALLHLWAAAALLILPMPGKLRFAVIPLAVAALSISAPLGVAMLVAFAPVSRPMLAIGAAWAFYFNGISLFWILAVLVLLKVKDIPENRLLRLLAVLELWGPGWGVFSLTALVLLVLRWMEERWQDCPAGLRPSFKSRELWLPERFLLGLGFVLLLAVGVKPGETVFNDEVLIGSHKEHVDLLKLFRPRSLEQWLELRGARFGFGDDEKKAVEVARGLEGRFVYLSGRIPDPRLSALVAASAGKSLRGWTSSLEPSSKLTAYLQSGRTEVLVGSGLDWVVSSDGESEQVPAGGQADVSVSLLATKLESSERSLPANSLVPLEVTITNPASYPQTSDGVVGLQFQVTYLSGKPLRPLRQPVTPIELPTLQSGDEVTVTVYLRTAIKPSALELKLALVSEDGQLRPTTAEGKTKLRTWAAAPPHAVPIAESKP